jgi:hypothetical protein
MSAFKNAALVADLTDHFLSTWMMDSEQAACALKIAWEKTPAVRPRAVSFHPGSHDHAGLFLVDGDEKRIDGLLSKKWSPMEESLKRLRSLKTARATQTPPLCS